MRPLGSGTRKREKGVLLGALGGSGEEPHKNTKLLGRVKVTCMILSIKGTSENSLVLLCIHGEGHNSSSTYVDHQIHYKANALNDFMILYESCVI